jgi:hypothetical protein
MVRKKNQLFRTGKVPIIKDRHAEHQSPKPGVAGSSPATPASLTVDFDQSKQTLREWTVSPVQFLPALTFSPARSTYPPPAAGPF